MRTYKINGKVYNVEITSVEGKTATVIVNGKKYTVEKEDAAMTQPAVQMPSQPTPQPASNAPTATPQQETAPAAGKGTTVTAPLPGVIIEVSVKVGDIVKEGDKVAVLEAMKMENVIEAEAAGTITSVNVNKGDSLLEGAPIVTIA